MPFMASYPSHMCDALCFLLVQSKPPMQGGVPASHTLTRRLEPFFPPAGEVLPTTPAACDRCQQLPERARTAAASYVRVYVGLGVMRRYSGWSHKDIDIMGNP